jgi:hypothetical protein
MISADYVLSFRYSINFNSQRRAKRFKEFHQGLSTECLSQRAEQVYVLDTGL